MKRRGDLSEGARWRRTRKRWRLLTTPRLNFVAGSGDASGAFVRQIRAVVTKADIAQGADHPRVASYPEETLDLAALGDADARLKPIAAALKLGSRRDTVTATVSIAPEGAYLRAIVEVAAPGAEGRAETFRAMNDSAGAVTPALAGQVAGWVLFAAEAMRSRIRVGSCAKETYGTASGAGFGKYLGGVQALFAGDIPGAGQLFGEAVDIDPENRRAIANLGLTECQNDLSEINAVGRARLHELLVPAGPRSGRPLSEADQLRVRFNLAVSYANSAMTVTQQRTELLKAAERQCVCLLGEILWIRSKDSAGQNDERWTERDLPRVLLELSVVLLACVLAEQKRCYVRPGGLDLPHPPREEDRRLCSMLNCTDTSADELLAFLGAEPGRSRPFVAYYVACFYSIVDRIDDAFDALAGAIAQPLLRESAIVDPWLVALQHDRRWALMFPPTPSNGQTTTLGDPVRVDGSGATTPSS